MTQLTCCQKAYINGLHAGGMKAKDIAIKVDAPLGTVYRIIKAGYTKDVIPRVETRGGHSKFSERDKRSVINFALKNDRATLNEIRTGCNINASQNTIRKILKDKKFVEKMVLS